MSTRKDAPGDRVQSQGQGRRAYTRPELVEYGPVSKLTQAGPGSAIEDSTALRRPMEAMCL
jgi:hypothetical protein